MPIRLPIMELDSIARGAPDPDRGWALAALTGALSFDATLLDALRQRDRPAETRIEHRIARRHARRNRHMVRNHDRVVAQVLRRLRDGA
jgi:hypothetical protein